MAPIVINARTRQAAQVIVEGTYPLRAPLRFDAPVPSPGSPPPAPPVSPQDPWPTQMACMAHTTAELMESLTGTAVDAPLCFTCGTKMRPSGSCYVCEGCGSTSGCS